MNTLCSLEELHLSNNEIKYTPNELTITNLTQLHHLSADSIIINPNIEKHILKNKKTSDERRRVKDREYFRCGYKEDISSFIKGLNRENYYY